MLDLLDLYPIAQVREAVGATILAMVLDQVACVRKAACGAMAALIGRLASAESEGGSGAAGAVRKEGDVGRSKGGDDGESEDGTAADLFEEVKCLRLD